MNYISHSEIVFISSEYVVANIIVYRHDSSKAAWGNFIFDVDTGECINSLQASIINPRKSESEIEIRKEFSEAIEKCKNERVRMLCKRMQSKKVQ